MYPARPSDWRQVYFVWAGALWSTILPYVLDALRLRVQWHLQVTIYFSTIIKHQMYIYTVTMPLHGIFAFKQMNCLDLPTHAPTSKRYLQHMVLFLYQL